MKKTRKPRSGSKPLLFFNETKTRPALPAGLPLARMKREILGARYELSVVVLGERAMRALNRTYRTRDTSTDILSFALSPAEGELYLSMRDVTKKAPRFGMSARHYLAYLFIHGCLHLKGHDHGRTMERLEDSWCRTFKIPAPTR